MGMLNQMNDIARLEPNRQRMHAPTRITATDNRPSNLASSQGSNVLTLAARIMIIALKRRAFGARALMKQMFRVVLVTPNVTVWRKPWLLLEVR